MAGNIRGITIEIGGDTTRLDRALREVNNTGRDLNSQLKDIEKSLKFNPGNAELIAQKQRVLAESVQNTREKLETLRTAQEQARVALENGEIGQDQYDALTREILRAENQLQSFERQQQQLNSTLYQMGERVGAFGAKAEELGNKFAPISAGAGAVITGLAGMAVNAGKTADDINTLSKVTGVSVESLQKFKLAEDVIDVSTETMAKGLAKLTKSMDGARNGSKDQKAAFEQLGVAITDSTGKLRDNEDVFNDTIAALAKIPNETERDAAAFRLFGKSAQELNPLILGGADALKEIGDKAEQAGLIMGQDALDNINAFNDELDTTKAVVTQAGLQLGATVGEVLLPFLQAGAEKIQQLATSLSEMSPVTVQVILAVLALVAGIAPLLIMIGKIGTGVSTLMKAFSALGPAMSASSGGFAALLGPIALTVAAIAGLVAVFVLLYKNNEDFRNKVNEVWGQVKEIISKTVEVIKSAVEKFVNLAKGLFDKHKKEISETTKAAWDAVQATVKAVTDLITKVVQSAVEVVKKLWSVFGDDIKKIAKTTWDGINQVISGALEAIKGIFNLFTGVLTGDWRKAGEGLKQIASGTWQALKGVFETGISNLKTVVKAGLDAVLGFFKGLKLPEIKIPKIKLPHFKIKGSFSISPPSVPYLGVDWYDKGGIFYGPQIIGVGEKRPEFVGALDDLRQIVGEVIDKRSGSAGAIYNINFNGDMHVRSDSDIRRLARALGDYIMAQNRTIGEV